MTKGTKSAIFILLASILLILFGGRYLVNFYSKRYSPPDITVTTNEINIPGGFMNPVNIEKLKVDSFGKEKRPIKYIIEYVTTCSIKQGDGEPVALDTIKLNEPGRYIWSGENVKIPIVHVDGFSKRSDSARKIELSVGFQKFGICPLKFEKGNWYFINFGDPVLIGVYIYFDKAGVLQKYSTYSGKSPIPQTT